MDYENITEILLFASCQRISCINVTIEDDNVLELVELFNVTLETTTGLDERISLSPVNGVVEIIDNDGMLTIVCVLYKALCILFSTAVAMVGLEETFYVVSEDVGIVRVCVIVYEPVPSPSVLCPIGIPFTVNLSTTGI